MEVERRIFNKWEEIKSEALAILASDSPQKNLIMHIGLLDDLSHVRDVSMTEGTFILPQMSTEYAWSISLRLFDLLRTPEAYSNTWINGTIKAFLRQFGLRQDIGLGSILAGIDKNKELPRKSLLKEIYVCIHLLMFDNLASLKVLLDVDERYWARKVSTTKLGSVNTSLQCLIYVVGMILFGGEDSEIKDLIVNVFSDYPDWKEISLHPRVDETTEKKTRRQDAQRVESIISKLPDVAMMVVFSVGNAILSKSNNNGTRCIIPRDIVDNFVLPVDGKPTKRARKEAMAVFDSLMRSNSSVEEFTTGLREMGNQIQYLAKELEAEKYDSYTWVIENAWKIQYGSWVEMLGKISREVSLSELYEQTKLRSDTTDKILEATNIILKRYAPRSAWELIFYDLEAKPFEGDRELIQEISKRYIVDFRNVDNKMYKGLFHSESGNPLADNKNLKLYEKVVGLFFPDNPKCAIRAVPSIERLASLIGNEAMLKANINVVIVANGENVFVASVKKSESLVKIVPQVTVVDMKSRGIPITQLATKVSDILLGEGAEKKAQGVNFSQLVELTRPDVQERYGLLYAIWLCDCIYAGYELEQIQGLAGLVGANMSWYIEVDYFEQYILSLL